jgi:HEPN domain-containing protein
MQPITAEWIAKAEEDFAVAGREFARIESPAYNAVCFHAQQAVEKFIKAVIQERNLPVPPTHNLPVLAKLIDKGLPFAAMRGSLAALSQLAVSSRYPGYFANKRAATEAMDTADQARMICRSLLELDLGTA